MQVTANSIRMEYEEFGDPEGVPIILVGGLGDQLISWPKRLIDGLVELGLRVIAYDNRDAGLSQKFPQQVSVDTSCRSAPPNSNDLPAAYSIDDMAMDLLGLCRALNIEKTHVIGSSLGGIILLAAVLQDPSRFLTATLLMSGLGAAPGKMDTLLAKPFDLEQFCAQKLRYNTQYGGSVYRKTDDEARNLAIRHYRRFYNHCADNRQLAASLRSDLSTESIAKLTIPFLIIAGEDDAIVPATLSRALANSLRNSRFRLVGGMGHTLSERLAPVLLLDIKDQCLEH